MKALIAILMLSLCPVAFAAPSEHNYKVKQGDWMYMFRHREGMYGGEIGKMVMVKGLSLIHISEPTRRS